MISLIFGINESTIAALVRRVRKKIEPTPGRPQFLINVKGRGYKLVGQGETTPSLPERSV